MTDEQEKSIIEVHANDNLPLLFADSLTINTRSDEYHLVRFVSNLPEGFKEQARMVIPRQSLRKMLDALCLHADYFPAKPTKSKRKTRKSS